MQLRSTLREKQGPPSGGTWGLLAHARLRDNWRIKGSHGLGEVVKGFGEIREAVETIGALSRKFDRFLEDYGKQNHELAEFNRALITEMKQLVSHMVGERPKTIVLRAISEDDAKSEILALFKSKRGQSLFYSDIASRLQLDLEMVVKLCHQLEEEGRLIRFSRPNSKGPYSA